MLNQRFFSLAFVVSSLIFIGCVGVEKKAQDSPLQILIGDGGVRIEKSYAHEDPKARRVAAFQSKHDQFHPSEVKLAGEAWVDESSPYEIEKKDSHCKVNVSRRPANVGDNFVYSVQVKVDDGIKDSPFEAVINGENEGLIVFGDYPLNYWESVKNLVLDDTMVVMWNYAPKKKHYEIVKKMGENQYLKKVLKFDAYLRKVRSVEYQILQDAGGGEMARQLTPIAKFSCS